MGNQPILLTDLIDIEELGSLFEKFSKATGFTTGLVDHETQQVLIGTGWRDICVKFHRADPAAAENCRISNQKLTSGANRPGETRIRKCLSGLIDGYTPIIIQEKHLADLYTGQVFFAPPDVNFFRSQAQEFGFEEDAYLQSLTEVPIVTKEKFKAALEYLSQLAMIIVTAAQANAKCRVESTGKDSLLQNILASVPAGIGLIVDRKIQWTNARMNTMVGYSSRELEGQNSRLLYATDDEFIRVGQEKYAQIKKQGTGTVETLLQKKDGSLIDVHLSSTPLNINDLSAGVVFSALDITDSKNIAATLQKSEERLQLTLQGANLGTWDWNIETGQVVFNQRATEMLGFTLEEFKPNIKSWEELLHPDEIEWVKAELNAHLEGRTPIFQIEYRLKTKSGNWCWILDTGKVFEWNDQGQPLRAAGTHLDITERKEAELELVKIHQELEQRVEERTFKLAETNRNMQQEIQQRKRSEEALLKTELDLEKQRATLEESNIALKVLMKESERERKEFEERVSANLLGLVEPYLHKLKDSGLDQRQANYLEIIESTLNNIVSPFVRTSVAMDLKLTPAEIQIANLIRQNRSSKEIAELLRISHRTVDKHRSNIRRKLGINNNQINLRTLLISKGGG